MLGRDAIFIEKFLNQACALLLEITTVRMYVCVSVCVCVSAPRPSITSGMIWCDMDRV